jgi:Arc/MetJ-type ribon-helix-helix transcriptional regulator
MGMKATFTLDDELMSQARAVVRSRRFKSLTAFMETAIADELEKVHREEIEKAIRKAAADPLFLADVTETEAYFAHADLDGGEE